MALSKDDKLAVERELRTQATPFEVHRFHQEVDAAHAQAAKTVPPDAGAGTFENLNAVYADALTSLRDLRDIAAKVYYGERG